MNEEEEKVKGRLKGIAKYVKNELPDGFGFVLLTFKFNAEPGISQMMYVSNANREDVILAMEEWVNHIKTQNDYGNDTGKY